MTAFNIVKMKVKPAFTKEFEQMNLDIGKRAPAGARSAHVVKVGDGTYFFVGEWNSFDDIVAARPQMIDDLDRFRHMLVEGPTGVTEPASGSAVISWNAPMHEVMHG